jgi:type II secretory pathway predicted ATPase ExeA
MSRIYEAIKKAEESRSKTGWESGGGLSLMELPERRLRPRWEPEVKTAPDCAPSESQVEFDASALVTINPAGPDEIFLVPTFAECPAEAEASLPADESLMERDNLPMWEVVEALERAFSRIAHECVVETSALQTQKAAKEVETAPDLSPSQDAVSAAICEVQDTVAQETGVQETAVQETPTVAEPDPLLMADSGPAEISTVPGQVVEAAGDVPQTALVAGAKETLPPSSLLSFFGLNQQPFDVTPDPAYLYLSRAHREALTSLSQGIENLRGFMTLVANPGLGKTTLLNKLTEDLGERARVVHLFQTQCNSGELLRYLLTELGLNYDASDVVAMHRTLNEILFQEMLQGRRFVLIVDEAQNLQDSVLETIRLLSDFETTHSKLIQIVLAGQPQLVNTLLRPGLSQLRQRIGIVANLKPLDAAEIAEYIEHRLRTAGSREKPVFTRDAMNAIAKRSQGTPRCINNLCFNAMLSAYSTRQEIIDIQVVENVAQKLDLESLVLSF